MKIIIKKGVEAYNRVWSSHRQTKTAFVLPREAFKLNHTLECAESQSPKSRAQNNNARRINFCPILRLTSTVLKINRDKSCRILCFHRYPILSSHVNLPFLFPDRFGASESIKYQQRRIYFLIYGRSKFDYATCNWQERRSTSIKRSVYFLFAYIRESHYDS